MIFSCSHSRRTWPLSRINGKRVRTYVVCLDCGKEFTYSWEHMKVVKEDKRKPVKEQSVREAVCR